MKRAAEAQAEPAQSADEARPPGDEQAPAEETRSDAEVLAELGLPEPETLQPGDDFTAFMARTVPARIRNRALRRLWLSNPLLSAVDEMVEYGEDYSDAATVIENLQTAYQVGRGFMDKISASGDESPEVAREPLPEEGEGPVAQAADDVAEDDVDGMPGDVAESPDKPASAVVAEGAPEIEASDAAARRLAHAWSPRRRMRFRLAEE